MKLPEGNRCQISKRNNESRADFICIPCSHSPVLSRGMTQGIRCVLGPDECAGHYPLDRNLLVHIANSRLQFPQQVGAQTCESHIPSRRVLLESPDMHVEGNSRQGHMHRAEFQPQAARSQLPEWLCCAASHCHPVLYLFASNIAPVPPVDLVFSLGLQCPAQGLAQRRWERTFIELMDG